MTEDTRVALIASWLKKAAHFRQASSEANRDGNQVLDAYRDGKAMVYGECANDLDAVLHASQEARETPEGEPLLIDGWAPRYVLDKAISMVSQAGNNDLANRLGELHNRIEGKTLWITRRHESHTPDVDGGATVSAAMGAQAVAAAQAHVSPCAGSTPADSLSTLRAQLAGYEHEQKMLRADLKRFVTDCSTPTFQLARNALEALENTEAQLAASEAALHAEQAAHRVCSAGQQLILDKLNDCEAERRALQAELGEARADVTRMAIAKIGDKCEHHKETLATLESQTLRECPICWKDTAKTLEIELHRLQDLPPCRLQVFNDGVPENTEQALQMWHRAAHNQANRADKAEAHVQAREAALAQLLTAANALIAKLDLIIPVVDGYIALAHIRSGSHYHGPNLVAELTELRRLIKP